MQSFHRILSFFGLEQPDCEFHKWLNWDCNKHNWFVHDTHNNLRIIKLLKCLNTLEIKTEAHDFYTALTQLRASEQNCGISETSFDFWAEAIQT